MSIYKVHIIFYCYCKDRFFDKWKYALIVPDEFKHHKYIKSDCIAADTWIKPNAYDRIKIFQYYKSIQFNSCS